MIHDHSHRACQTHHRDALAHTDRPAPASALDAKFSVQYCVARALLSGSVTFEHFDEGAYVQPEVRKLLERVEAHPHAHESKGMSEQLLDTLRKFESLADVRELTDGLSRAVKDVAQPRAAA